MESGEDNPALRRIDRIGSKNDVIQLVNFWPDMTLDEYIDLKGRVEARMKVSVMTSTGDDNLISLEEKGDLEYRKAQLKKLQEEVVDIEEMPTSRRLAVAPKLHLIGSRGWLYTDYDNEFGCHFGIYYLCRKL